MAKLSTRGGWRTRLTVLASSALLCASTGCGLTHGRYQGDPLLGNFNRPIAPTPPIWTGGDPGFTPAYDGGAHIGLPSPDVPARSNPTLERMFIVPTFSGSLGLSSLFGGGSSGSERVSGSEATPNRRGGVGSIGARLLPGSADARKQPTFTPGSVTTNAQSVTPRSNIGSNLLTSGSAIEPVSPPTAPLSPILMMKDPRTVATVEEGQTILQTCGAKSQQMEMEPTGEWKFVCTLHNGTELRRYEVKSADQLEAVRAVMTQVKKEQ